MGPSDRERGLEFLLVSINQGLVVLQSPFVSVVNPVPAHGLSCAGASTPSCRLPLTLFSSRALRARGEKALG